MFRKLFSKKTGFVYILAYLMAFVVGMAPSVRALELVVTDNGSGSSNEVTTSVEQTTTVEQTNKASVSNDVTLDSNTGGNEASLNTGGDVSITTGNVSQNVSVETAVNSSVIDAGCCPEATKAKISGNGAGSTNTIDINQTNTSNLSTKQAANVTNNIQGSANTGENTTNNNTGGNVSIDTGNIKVSGGVVNGPINVSSIKASAGGGSADISISGNGAGSQNTIRANFDSQTNASTDFFANIRNFINWDLNTGRNSANGNTGGDVSITTGDIFFDLLLKNGPINFGFIDIDCCPFDPGDEDYPPDGDGPPDGGGGPGGGEEETSDGSSPGQPLTEAGPPSGGGGEVLGLGATGGLANPLIFWTGVIMLMIGLREVSSRLSYEKNFRKKR